MKAIWLTLLLFAFNTRAEIPANVSSGLRQGGVNLVFGWYDTDNPRLNEFDAELPLIKSAGGGHVRLVISMDMIESGTTGSVREDRWVALKDFVAKARSAGLVTIIDIHNTGLRVPGQAGWSEDYMGQLRNAAVADRHLRLHADLSGRVYRELDRNWIVYQPANEPIYGENPAIWYNHQNKLIPEIRRNCPDCVIFAMAHNWQGVGATINYLAPAQTSWWDTKVIADVHMYAPLALSHCSYPGQTDKCAGKTWPGIYPGEWLPASGTQFSGEWNKSVLDQELRQLWDWRARNKNVPIHFSEIGTTAALADDPRSAYIGDITSLLAANGASWSCFEWNANFGIKNHPKTVKSCFRGMSGTPAPTPTPAPTLPGSLLINGDFEAGLSGHTIVGGTVATTTDAHTGKMAALFTGRGWNALQQGISPTHLVAGKKYSLKVAGKTNGGRLNVKVNASTGTLAELVFTGESYATKEVSFVAPSGLTWAVFYVEFSNPGAASGMVDTASLLASDGSSQTPAPSPTPAPAPTAPGSLLINGDFEAGLDGHSVLGGTVTTTTDAHSGKMAALFTGPGWNAFQQGIAPAKLVAGKTYVLKAAGKTSGGYLRVKINSNKGTLADFEFTADSYVSKEVSFVAPSGLTWAIFYVEFSNPGFASGAVDAATLTPR